MTSGSAPAPTTGLDATTVSTVAPTSPGVYAAWIESESALADLGIAGPPPVLVYVGIAKNLRQRLASHVPGPHASERLPFQHLLELLANNGRVLPCWWMRADQPAGAGYRPEPSALARMALDQALDWQAANLRWGWTATPYDEARRRETDAIRALTPLLNRRSDTTALPPPLRRPAKGSRVAARWLWQIAWCADFLALPPTATDLGKDEDQYEYIEIQADGDGYPASGSERPRILARAPKFDDADVRDMMMMAVEHDGELRTAIAAAPSFELRAWWAAHAATCVLWPGSDPFVRLYEGIAESLVLDDPGLVEPAPRRLPQNPADAKRLSEREQWLTFHRH